jgi:hypothetical protein
MAVPAKARTLPPQALEYAKALVEYADGLRALKPEPPPGLRAEELYLALRALGRDPVEVARRARERWEARERRERLAEGLAARLKELLPGRDRLGLLVRAGGRERRLLLHRLLFSQYTYALIDEEGRPVSVYSWYLPPGLEKRLAGRQDPDYAWKRMADSLLLDLTQLLGAEPEAVEPQP